MDILNELLDSVGLPALFAMMLLKAVGVPVPVPSDLLMIGAGAAAAQGRLGAVEAFVAVLLGLFAGSTAQYAMARGPARGLLQRSGSRVGLTPARMETLGRTLRRGGPGGIAVALVTPGLKIGAVAACGLAAVPWGTFLTGLGLGSAGSVTFHMGVGFFGGALLPALNVPPWALAAAVGPLALIGLGVSWQLRRRAAGAGAGLGETLQAWHDTACPACLLVAAVQREQVAPRS